MAIRESKVESAINAYADENGVKHYKQTGPDGRSKPDQLYMKNGVALFIEIKRPGEKPTPGQLRELKELQAVGMIAEWVDNARDGRRLIHKHLLLENPL